MSPQFSVGHHEFSGIRDSTVPTALAVTDNLSPLSPIIEGNNLLDDANKPNNMQLLHENKEGSYMCTHAAVESERETKNQSTDTDTVCETQTMDMKLLKNETSTLHEPHAWISNQHGKEHILDAVEHTKEVREARTQRVGMGLAALQKAALLKGSGDKINFFFQSENAKLLDKLDTHLMHQESSTDTTLLFNLDEVVNSDTVATHEQMCPQSPSSHSNLFENHLTLQPSSTIDNLQPIYTSGFNLSQTVDQIDVSSTLKPELEHYQNFDGLINSQTRNDFQTNQNDITDPLNSCQDTKDCSIVADLTSSLTFSTSPDLNHIHDKTLKSKDHLLSKFSDVSCPNVSMDVDMQANASSITSLHSAICNEEAQQNASTENLFLTNSEIFIEEIRNVCKKCHESAELELAEFDTYLKNVVERFKAECVHPKRSREEIRVSFHELQNKIGEAVTLVDEDISVLLNEQHLLGGYASFDHSDTNADESTNVYLGNNENETAFVIKSKKCMTVPVASAGQSEDNGQHFLLKQLSPAHESASDRDMHDAETYSTFDDIEMEVKPQETTSTRRTFTKSRYRGRSHGRNRRKGNRIIVSREAVDERALRQRTPSDVFLLALNCVLGYGPSDIPLSSMSAEFTNDNKLSLPIASEKKRGPWLFHDSSLSESFRMLNRDLAFNAIAPLLCEVSRLAVAEFRLSQRPVPSFTSQFSDFHSFLPGVIFHEVSPNEEDEYGVATPRYQEQLTLFVRRSRLPERWLKSIPHFCKLLLQVSCDNASRAQCEQTIKSGSNTEFLVEHESGIKTTENTINYDGGKKCCDTHSCFSNSLGDVFMKPYIETDEVRILTLSRDILASRNDFKGFIEIAFYLPTMSSLHAQRYITTDFLSVSDKVEVVRNTLTSRRIRINKIMKEQKRICRLLFKKWKQSYRRKERIRRSRGDEFAWGILPVRAVDHPNQFVPLPAGFRSGDRMAPYSSLPTSVESPVSALSEFRRSARSDNHPVPGNRQRTREGADANKRKRDWLQGSFVNLTGPGLFWRDTCIFPKKATTKKPAFIEPIRLISENNENAILDRSRCCRFVSHYSRISDPIFVEHEKKMSSLWSKSEVQTFVEKYLMYPKNFERISQYLNGRTVRDCVEFYYQYKYFFGLKRMLQDLDDTSKNRKRNRSVCSRQFRREELVSEAMSSVFSLYPPRLETFYTQNFLIPDVLNDSGSLKSAQRQVFKPSIASPEVDVDDSYEKDVMLENLRDGYIIPAMHDAIILPGKYALVPKNASGHCDSQQKVPRFVLIDKTPASLTACHDANPSFSHAQYQSILKALQFFAFCHRTIADGSPSYMTRSFSGRGLSAPKHLSSSCSKADSDSKATLALNSHAWDSAVSTLKKLIEESVQTAVRHDPLFLKRPLSQQFLPSRKRLRHTNKNDTYKYTNIDETDLAESNSSVILDNNVIIQTPNTTLPSAAMLSSNQEISLNIKEEDSKLETKPVVVVSSNASHIPDTNSTCQTINDVTLSIPEMKLQPSQTIPTHPSQQNTIMKMMSSISLGILNDDRKKNRRVATKWSDEEKSVYFKTYKMYGRSWEHLLAALAPYGKTREQVKNFYQNTIAKRRTKNSNSTSLSTLEATSSSYPDAGDSGISVSSPVVGSAHVAFNSNYVPAVSQCYTIPHDESVNADANVGNALSGTNTACLHNSTANTTEFISGNELLQGGAKLVALDENESVTVKAVECPTTSLNTAEGCFTDVVGKGIVTPSVSEPSAINPQPGNDVTLADTIPAVKITASANDTISSNAAWSNARIYVPPQHAYPGHVMASLPGHPGRFIMLPVAAVTRPLVPPLSPVSVSFPVALSTPSTSEIPSHTRTLNISGQQYIVGRCGRDELISSPLQYVSTCNSALNSAKSCLEEMPVFTESSDSSRAFNHQVLKISQDVPTVLPENVSQHLKHTAQHVPMSPPTSLSTTTSLLDESTVGINGCLPFTGLGAIRNDVTSNMHALDIEKQRCSLSPTGVGDVSSVPAPSDSSKRIPESPVSPLLPCSSFPENSGIHGS